MGDGHERLRDGKGKYVVVKVVKLKGLRFEYRRPAEPPRATGKERAR